MATAIGLVTGTVSGAASLVAIFQILPFLSGAFVPTETMPGWLQAFAANQPMTHIAAALRARLTGSPVGNEAWLAVAWCAGAAVAGYLWARRRQPPDHQIGDVVDVDDPVAPYPRLHHMAEARSGGDAS